MGSFDIRKKGELAFLPLRTEHDQKSYFLVKNEFI